MPVSGRLLGSTRRNFIRGIAAAGASTATAVALERTGMVDLFAEDAKAARANTPFSQFNAIAASSDDAFQVPEGFLPQRLISYKDTFQNDRGETFTFGYNNDWLGYFPLNGSEEGLLFVNHEYPEPFFQHGYKQSGVVDPAAKRTKSAADVQAEQDAVGNSIVHVKRNADGTWAVVSPSPYNRRVYGDRPNLEFTGPLRGAPGIGTFARGSVGNCSGGYTPWGTALSCEENYDGYGVALGSRDFYYGWPQNGGQPEDADYEFKINKKYGWVVEHDPYDPDFTPRKHTALGRFRHENTAFRHVPGRKFVLYMGDDANDQCIYKFVSDIGFKPGANNNGRILESGTLYVARFEPGGRRTFAARGDTVPTSPTSGTGRWVEVLDSELDDLRLKLSGLDVSATGASSRRPPNNQGVDNNDPAYSGRFNREITVNGTQVNEFDRFFATNRPEDIEVAEDGTIYVALTNNTNSVSGQQPAVPTAPANDQHGSVRRMQENDNTNPDASLAFTWADYAAGGPRGGTDPGRQGFSSPDNLVFDKGNNLWVVTDISSSTLKGSVSPRPDVDFHGNNAAFMVPTSGPNAGVAFRFANMPIESEGTGPYFTPDEQTLFLAVQHPGEETKNRASSVFGTPATYSSYWPNGNKTANQNPSEPLPAVMAITRVPANMADPPPPFVPAPEQPGKTADTRAPGLQVIAPRSVSLREFLRRGLEVSALVDEGVSVRFELVGRPAAERKRRGSRGSQRQRKIALAVATTRKLSSAGLAEVRLKPSARIRLLLARRRSARGQLIAVATDAAGNKQTSRRSVKIG